ncbi:hypothetical protein C8J55DRAFT_521018 [Lentinula edodes]|uniref:Uncharacterized protein n=1 Tax=Lentinula lateritia TaxID=40482 RepID=A0A9W9A0W8_9AGAR|nr:hypothetical protein C8J55DRAFT_521018 [Lentinula edodes]
MCLPSPFPLLSVLFFNCGFDRENKWDFRALEPSRCCMSLVPLKTGTTNYCNWLPLENISCSGGSPRCVSLVCSDGISHISESFY